MKTFYKIYTTNFSIDPDDTIKPIQVERETPSYIWISGDRSKTMKRPSYGYQYFSTKKEAVEFIREDAARELSSSESRYAGLDREYQDKKARLEHDIKEGKKRLERINSLLPA